MKVLFMANIPSPYRVDFFNELGKHCDLTVTFEGKTATDRDEKWKTEAYNGFTPVFLKGIRTKSDQFLCLGIIQMIRRGFDHIIIGGYSTPTAMLAIEYMRLHQIPFFIEADGGMIADEGRLKYRIKRHFISAASGWFSSGRVTTEYLVHYGAIESRVYGYPFTSLRKEDIREEIPSEEEKNRLRRKLGMGKDRTIILSVGRFSYLGGYGKGFDVLLKAMRLCPETCELYIVGDEPTREFLEMKERLQLDHVVFVGFKNKNELKEYYEAADLFCLQTRGDVWGLVINEAMACGLPIITTEKCVAGLELVEKTQCGYIVPVEDEMLLAERIRRVATDNRLRNDMSMKALQTIRDYTIENMAHAHMEALRDVGSEGRKK